MVLRQAPGQVEEYEGRPFVGPTGQIQTEHFFPLASLERGKNVHIANVLKCRWIKDGKKTDELPPEPLLTRAVEHCTNAHLRVPEGTRLIVAEGGLAASWCAGQHVSVYRWRGHLLYPRRRDLPTTYVVEHLASVTRDPKMWWVAELDWRKITRLPEWFQSIPGRLIASASNWGSVIEWFVEASRTAPEVAIDTEYIGRPFEPGQPILTIIGLAYRSREGVIKGLQLHCRSAEGWMKASFYHHLQELVRICPVIFQNYAADMPILKRCAGVQYESYKRIDDTMLGHAILYCELPHDLEFLTSIYGMFPKLKHLGDNDVPEATKWESLRWLQEHNGLTVVDGDTPDLLYNWGDAIETLTIKGFLDKGFETDPQAYSVYQNQSLKLIPQLIRSMERGIKVNKPRVMAAKVEYEERVRMATKLAETYYGRPINIGSDMQLKYYCYHEMGYPIQYKQDTKQPTVDENAIAVLRDYVGPVVDARTTLTFDGAMQRILEGADPILEARVLYQDAQHALDSYIYGLVAVIYTELDKNRKKRLRELIKKEGFTEADLVERIHPNFAIHAQKNARWSTTGIPLAQLPADLRNIIIPDGVWLHWDWKGIELHFLEVHSGSRILKQAHSEGIDLHTWTMCKMFGYDMPPDLKNPFSAPENQAWRDRYNLRSSSDPRRVFAKSARYEMNYGGQGSTAAEKAIRLGLSKQEVQSALSKLLTADVDYFKWRQSIERQVKATRVIRTFMGRPRRFLTVGRGSSGTTVPPKVVREALDYQMQAGVSDVLNTTLVQITDKYPFLAIAWTIHDAVYLECPLDRLSEDVVAGVKEIATQPYIIEGVSKSFPIDFDIIYPPTTNREALNETK